MKNKKEKEISDNSDSDNFNTSNINNYNHNVKCNDDENLDSQAFEENSIDLVEEPLKYSWERNARNESNCEVSQKSPNQNFGENSIQGNLDTVRSTFNIDELSPDDEVYILQCPENFTKQDLCDKNLDLTKHKLSVTHNNEIYRLELLNSEKKFITLAVPEGANSGSLVKLPFRGHIIIKKNVNMVSNEPDDVQGPDSHQITFPNDIKVRHPLLGADWKSYIELANEAIGKHMHIKKKRKKSKGEKQQDYENESIKLKRKNDDSEISVHKKKKKKHDIC